MQDVEVPKENLVGNEGEGFHIAMFALDQGRYTVAAGATGLIRACLDASVKYAKETGDIRQTDRPAPTGQANDREHGQGLRLLSTAMDAVRLDEEQWSPKHSGDIPRKVVCHGEPRSAPPPTPSKSTGPTATPMISRWAVSSAMPKEQSFTREPAKSIRLMQADYALGYREDKPSRCTLPKVRNNRKFKSRG